MPRLRLAPSLVALLGGVACGNPGGGGDGSLAMVVDSTADTVFVRIDGAVPAAQIRTLTAEFRIAPTADDTTLFTDVYEFDVDRAGRFWVFDRPTSTIFLFSPDGALLRRIGRSGSGPGELRSDNGMVTRPDSGLAIWDARNARISFFDAEGDFAGSWVIPAGFSTSNGLISDRSGDLYLRRPVSAPREGEILGRMGLVRLQPGGAFGDSLAPPDLDVSRQPYVANSKGGRSSTSSEYAAGYEWAWHPDGYFLVADGGRYDIILARHEGKPLVIRRGAPAVPIPDAARDENRAWITYAMRQTDPGWTWSGPAIPSALAPVRSLFVARDGRIWVEVAAPLERIPDSTLVAPRDSTTPIQHYRVPVAYEVFEPDGRFVARIDPGIRARLIEADGDLVWAIVRDADGLPALVRFRIDPPLR